MTEPRTIVEKIWDDHVVGQDPGAPAILAVDLHLVHEVTSPQAFAGLRARGLARPPPGADRRDGRPLDADPPAHRCRSPTRWPRPRSTSSTRNCDEFGIPLHGLGSPSQGIVHVIGPQLGLTQPGHDDRLRRLAHRDPRRVRGAGVRDRDERGRDGPRDADAAPARSRRPTRSASTGGSTPGVSAKDIILALIARIGIGGGTGHVFEYRGEAIRALTMEQRMTICNMSIEGGARAGLIAPDDTTFEYVHGRAHAPQGAAWDAAVAGWRTLPTDDGATFDRSITIDAGALEPMVTYGTNPGMGIPITSSVPLAGRPGRPVRAPRASSGRSSTWISSPGQPILGQKVDVVFIGSCTNGRISDLRLAAVRPQGPQGRRRRPGDDRPGLGRGEARGRARGPPRGLPRRRRRVARGRLLDVHRDERRPALAGPVRDLDVEPELRGPPGQGRPDVPRLAADRRRVRDRRRRRRSPPPAPGSSRSRRSAGADMAEPFATFTSRVIPLPAENVDTDQIVPARYLKVTDKDGLADALFRDWRFEEDGSLREPRFVLDDPAMAGRRILLVGDNFGAGSSREHAPWALTAWGIRAILSTSFADIFRNNSLKNGLLPIVVEAEQQRQLFELVGGATRTPS